MASDVQAQCSLILSAYGRQPGEPPARTSEMGVASAAAVACRERNISTTLFRKRYRMPHCLLGCVSLQQALQQQRRADAKPNHRITTKDYDVALLYVNSKSACGHAVMLRTRQCQSCNRCWISCGGVRCSRGWLLLETGQGGRVVDSSQVPRVRMLTEGRLGT